MQPSITLILMMYNEEPNIAEALGEAITFAESTLDDWEIVVVDDGSSDGCAAIVEGIAAGHDAVHLVRHAKNRGMGAGMFMRPPTSTTAPISISSSVPG